MRGPGRGAGVRARRRQTGGWSAEERERIAGHPSQLRTDEPPLAAFVVSQNGDEHRIGRGNGGRLFDFEPCFWRRCSIGARRSRLGRGGEHGGGEGVVRHDRCPFDVPRTIAGQVGRRVTGIDLAQGPVTDQPRLPARQALTLVAGNLFRSGALSQMRNSASGRSTCNFRQRRHR